MTDSSPASPEGDSRTRRHILETAKRLFAERGAGSVSMSDIGQGAGVSKASVFYHFGSKAELHHAIVRDITGRAAALIDALGSGTGTAAEDLRAFAEGHLKQLLDDPHASRMMLLEVTASSPEQIRALAEDYFHGNFRRLVEVVRGHQEGGGLRRDVDPALVATLLIAANVFFFIVQPLLRHFPEVGFADEPQSYARMASALLLDGLIPPEHERTDP